VPNPSKPKDWNWSASNKAISISGSKVSGAAGQKGMVYEREALGFGSVWKLTVSKFSEGSNACFGIHDFD
jgi:hypothetical protein